MTFGLAPFLISDKLTTQKRKIHHQNLNILQNTDKDDLCIG